MFVSFSRRKNFLGPGTLLFQDPSSVFSIPLGKLTIAINLAPWATACVLQRHTHIDLHTYVDGFYLKGESGFFLDNALGRFTICHSR